MTLKSQITSDVTTIFLNTREFAESVTYTPSDGTALTITAVVERETFDENFGGDGRHLTKMAFVHVAAADVASPSINDVFTFDSLDWKVSAIPDPPEFGMTRIEVKRVERIETSSPEYRIPR